MADGAVHNFDDAQRSDTERYGALFRHLLERGIYIAPSQFEAMFLSLAHGDKEIDRTVEVGGALRGAIPGGACPPGGGRQQSYVFSGAAHGRHRHAGTTASASR